MIPGRFSGRRILLGISGGIAAYKSCYLIRELVSQGAEVRVILTPSALSFVTPLTVSTLSGCEALTDIFSSSSVKHIEYALWPDLIIVAPATMNTVAKIAHGIADNALLSTVLARRCPIILAPSADMDMYGNQISRKNIDFLKELGLYILEGEEGFLASGLSGPGRMASIEKIADAADSVLSGCGRDLLGRKILITAGPTYEDIDPVRYLGNKSSGKMGYAIAKAAYLRGASVELISGPTSETAYPEIGLEKVRTALEMQEAVKESLKLNEILIMAAAVADFAPVDSYDKKIKKLEEIPSISLKKNPDVLASLNKTGKTVVGFALETDDEKNNARKKLIEKGLDMIVLNSLNDQGAGFEGDTNKVCIFTRELTEECFPLMSKFQTANKILNSLIKIL